MRASSSLRRRSSAFCRAALRSPAACHNSAAVRADAVGSEPPAARKRRSSSAWTCAPSPEATRVSSVSFSSAGRDAIHRASPSPSWTSRLTAALSGMAYRRASGRSRLLMAGESAPAVDVEKTDPDGDDDLAADGKANPETSTVATALSSLSTLAMSAQAPRRAFPRPASDVSATRRLQSPIRAALGPSAKRESVSARPSRSRSLRLRDSPPP